MDPEHPKSRQAVLDAPVDAWDLINDTARECSAEMIEQRGARSGVGHSIIMPETSDAPRIGSGTGGSQDLRQSRIA